MQGHSHPLRSLLDAEPEKQVSRSGFLDRVDAVMDWTALSRMGSIRRQDRHVLVSTAGSLQDAAAAAPVQPAFGGGSGMAVPGAVVVP